MTNYCLRIRKVSKNIFYGLIDFLSSFFKKKNKKYMLFVVQNELMFLYALEVYKIFKDDVNLKIYFCYHRSAIFDKNLMTSIKEEYRLQLVPFGIARRLKWDMILYPSHCPYFRRDCKKILIGHGLFSGKKNKKESYVFGPHSRYPDGTIRYDKIFVQSEFIKKMLDREFSEFKNTIKTPGNLFMDILIGNNNGTAIKEKLSLEKKRKTVMISSTWGSQSLVQMFGDKIFGEATQLCEEYNIIIAVHPQNYVAKYSGGIDRTKWLSGFKRKNIYICDSGKDNPIFYLPAVDMLISDHTSLSLYYLSLARPNTFVEIPNVAFEESSPISDYKEISYKYNFGKTLKFNILAGFNSFDEIKTKKLRNKLFDMSGKSKEKHSSEICDSLYDNKTKVSICQK